jgi:hypothetical protein
MKLRSGLQRALVALAVSSLAWGLSPGNPAGGSPPAAGDPRAEQVAKEVWQALGGDAAWNQARFLRFRFDVEKGGKTLASFRHAWDRFTGRYRLEGTNKEGKPFVVLLNINDRTGKAWVDGKPADPEKTKKMVENAYGRHINDSYWFLMPYKMRDPGVHLAFEGEKSDEAGRKWQVVGLSFDSGIGLTSGDRYHAYIDPATHRMGRWDYELEGEDHEKGSWTWAEWKPVGGLLLCEEKKEIGGDTVIRTPFETVSATVDESAFVEPK